MKFFSSFNPDGPQGIHPSNAATQWASARFVSHLQPLAAYVADLLCHQVGTDLQSIEPTSNFIEDLGMDDLEPVEFCMALEHEVGIKIPEEDHTHLITVAALVSYLSERLSSNARGA